MRLGFVAIRALGAFTLWSGAISAAVPEPWPREAKGKVKFAEISQKELPQGLKFDLKTFDLRDSHPVSVCWMDLDRDGTPELLVDTHEGGTGGTFKVIFAKTASGFRRIGSWLGSITVLVPAGAQGYYQFGSWSSGGGGEFTRGLHRYERGRYRLVRLEVWRGTETEAGFEFVRRLDPKGQDVE